MDVKYYIKFITSASLVISTLSYATPLSVKNQEDCHSLANHIKKDTIDSFTSSIQDINTRYEFVKKFSAGKGGAYVAQVKDKTSGINKVLKIFPTIAKENNKYNYRELFYTCLNSFITYKDLGITITSGGGAATDAFPKVFELGMTNAPDLDSTGSSYVFPYMVFEFIDGKSLTTLAENASQPINVQQYNLYKKGHSDNFSTENKRKTEVVLYQIVHMLYKIHRIKIKDKDYGFYHADLNPGNIMVRNTNFSGILDAGYGPIAVSDVPQVTFIDFGHSTSNFDNALGSKVESLKVLYHKSLHFFSGSAADFYRNLNESSLGKLSETAIGLSATNSDMRLYRVIARSLFDSENYIHPEFMKHLRDCNTKTKCVEKAPALFRSGR